MGSPSRTSPPSTPTRRAAAALTPRSAQEASAARSAEKAAARVAQAQKDDWRNLQQRPSPGLPPFAQSSGSAHPLEPLPPTTPGRPQGSSEDWQRRRLCATKDLIVRSAAHLTSEQREPIKKGTLLVVLEKYDLALRFGERQTRSRVALAGAPIAATHRGLGWVTSFKNGETFLVDPHVYGALEPPSKEGAELDSGGAGEAEGEARAAWTRQPGRSESHDPRAWQGWPGSWSTDEDG